ncbi:Ig-like domain-containing protein, partial [Sulfitobacter delicatus]
MPWHFNNWNNWYNWYNFSNTYLNPAPDSASTTEDSNTSFNVLSNDSSSSSKFVTHVNGATIAIGDVIVLSGGGELVYDGSGNFTFDTSDGYDWLAEGESTTETFQYTVQNSQGLVRVETVTINVTGTNDGPVASADSGGTDEDTAVVLDVLANDSDPDASDTLTVSSASVQSGLGTVSVAADGSSISYDPGTAYNSLAVGETATVEILYEISDGNGGTSSALVTVTVTGTNDGPVASA